jgi:hypothetical protein
MAELIVYIDVEDPVLNVYAERQEQPIEVGETVDFGAAYGNSMAGSWLVLSHERFPASGEEPPLLRVNVIRPQRYAGD